MSCNNWFTKWIDVIFSKQPIISRPVCILGTIRNIFLFQIWMEPCRCHLRLWVPATTSAVVMMTISRTTTRRINFFARWTVSSRTAFANGRTATFLATASSRLSGFIRRLHSVISDCILCFSHAVGGLLFLDYVLRFQVRNEFALAGRKVAAGFLDRSQNSALCSLSFYSVMLICFSGSDIWTLCTGWTTSTPHRCESKWRLLISCRIRYEIVSSFCSRIDHLNYIHLSVCFHGR